MSDERSDLALLRAYRLDGDETTRRELIESYVPLVRALATRYANRGEELDEFSIGGSRVVQGSPDDAVAIVAAGITVYEARRAARMLEKEDISARIIDLYSIKPLGAATLLEGAEVTDGRLVTVEDHWPEGGLGDAVLEVFASGELPVRIRKLAVREMPGSGPPDALLSQAGIDSHHIAQAARLLVRPHESAGIL